MENLSKRLDFSNDNDQMRCNFALAVADKGLSESTLQTQLMRKADLDWRALSDTL